VSCIDAAGLGDGVVHLVYQNTSGAILYRQRSVAGVWADEVTLSDNTRTTVNTNPRLSFGSGGTIYVTWSDSTNGCIWLAEYDGGTWLAPQQLIVDDIIAEHEHCMPAILANGSILPVAYQVDSHVQKFKLCAV